MDKTDEDKWMNLFQENYQNVTTPPQQPRVGVKRLPPFDFKLHRVV